MKVYKRGICSRLRKIPVLQMKVWLSFRGKCWVYLPCAQSFLGFSLQPGWSQGPEVDEPLV